MAVRLGFFFIHINKTGGSSIEQALGYYFGHRTASEKIADLGKAAWKKLFSFAIVRNPWDRVVSHFHYRAMTNQSELGAKAIGFNEWVKLAYGENVPEYYDKPKMFMPQWHWLIDEKGRPAVSFIGRFENLQDDFAKICMLLNREAELPHLKKSDRGNYRQYYSTASIEIVERWFQDDIEKFGYKF
ncbi:sulfotransferase family 2 domain-containing protein [candidate division KSB1 bacterium]|nr:sulfotransferase family 2 domain-containing protein [candidate division KSB1 bacterium]